MGTYRHQWDVGASSSTVDAPKAMAIIIARPNDIFPFKVIGSSTIMLGKRLDLMNTIGPRNFGLGPDPVEVTAVSGTAFTFTTLAGHHRGAGQTISFETLASGGHVHLTQYGTFNSLDPRQYGYNAGATGAWALQAHNLRVALGTLGQAGLGTSEAALDAIVAPTYLNVFP